MWNEVEKKIESDYLALHIIWRMGFFFCVAAAAAIHRKCVAQIDKTEQRSKTFFSHSPIHFSVFRFNSIQSFSTWIKNKIYTGNFLIAYCRKYKHIFPLMCLMICIHFHRFCWFAVHTLFSLCSFTHFHSLAIICKLIKCKFTKYDQYVCFVRSFIWFFVWCARVCVYVCVFISQ